MPTRTPIFYEQHGSSSRSIDWNSPCSQSGDESSNGKRKMRSMKDIYDDLDVSSNFALLSSNLLRLKKQPEMKIGCKPWMKKLKLLKRMIHGISFIF